MTKKTPADEINTMARAKIKVFEGRRSKFVFYSRLIKNPALDIENSLSKLAILMPKKGRSTIIALIPRNGSESAPIKVHTKALKEENL